MHICMSSYVIRPNGWVACCAANRRMPVGHRLFSKLWQMVYWSQARKAAFPLSMVQTKKNLALNQDASLDNRLMCLEDYLADPRVHGCRRFRIGRSRLRLMSRVIHLRNKSIWRTVK